MLLFPTFPLSLRAKLRLAVPSITLAGFDFRAGRLPDVGREGAPHVITLRELSAGFAANESFVNTGVNQFAFARRNPHLCPAVLLGDHR